MHPDKEHTDIISLVVYIRMATRIASLSIALMYGRIKTLVVCYIRHLMLALGASVALIGKITLLECLFFHGNYLGIFSVICSMFVAVYLVLYLTYSVIFSVWLLSV